MADLSAVDNNAGISYWRVPRIINVYVTVVTNEFPGS